MSDGYLVIIWTATPHIVSDGDNPNEHWVAESREVAEEFCRTNPMAHALGASIIDIEAREMEFAGEGVFIS